MKPYLITPIILATMTLLGAGCSPAQPQAINEDVQPTVITEKLFDKTDEMPPVNTEPVAEASKIEGQWQSTDDDQSIVEFSDILKMDYYGDLLMSEAAYQQEGDILRIDSSDGELLYTIIEITDDTLVLNYTNRGNTLSYTRIIE